MFREGLCLLFVRAQGADDAVPSVDADALVRSCAEGRFDVVVFEAGGAPWDGAAVAGRLKVLQPGARLVGTGSPGIHWSDPDGRVQLVPRTAPPEQFAAVATAPASPGGGTRGAPVGPAGLTGTELQVLALVGAGLTTELIARRLRVSIKTVEKRRQQLFRKLGVQNQSHAVAVAMRSGLIGPVRMPAER